MARYNNGIQGPFSGKVGNVVGASSRGVNYLRAAAKPGKKAPSVAQLQNRKIFAMVMNWLKPILPVINVGFRMGLDGKTPLNRAVGLQLKQAVINDDQGMRIDYSRAILSRGFLLVSWIREVEVLPGGILSVKWENPAYSMYSSLEDEAVFVVYNPGKAQFVTFVNPARREDMEVRLSLPLDFLAESIHCWMSYVSATAEMQSTSVYVGEISIVI